MALMQRGSAREIVLVNRSRRVATAVALDMGYGAPVSPTVDIRDGSYEDLEEADLVMITAGVNEKTGGATDRSKPEGRLKLLDANVPVYKEIVPRKHHHHRGKQRQPVRRRHRVREVDGSGPA
jgi:L-lactate dehydrogenase